MAWSSSFAFDPRSDPGMRRRMKRKRMAAKGPGRHSEASSSRSRSKTFSVTGCDLRKDLSEVSVLRTEVTTLVGSFLRQQTREVATSGEAAQANSDRKVSSMISRVRWRSAARGAAVSDAEGSSGDSSCRVLENRPMRVEGENKKLSGSKDTWSTGSR